MTRQHQEQITDLRGKVAKLERRTDELEDLFLEGEAARALLVEGMEWNSFDSLMNGVIIAFMVLVGEVVVKFVYWCWATEDKYGIE
jgi:hypothetical protein